MKHIVFILLLHVGLSTSVKGQSENNYPKSLANYDDFKTLVIEVEEVRSTRLIDLNTFNKLSKEENTIILDTRSRDKFANRHIKGAINLPFTEFTQPNLEGLIPDKYTRILIYCNNNFSGDIVNLASKIYIPKFDDKGKLIEDEKEITLALNIPTYINLYGYGYRNILELEEMVNVFDSRVHFEGKHVPSRSTSLLISTKNTK